jgi:cytochrome c peroxidase
MHGGALATLDDVLRFYARVGGGGPNPPPGVGPLDPLLAPLRFSPAEAADMIDFLRALSDEQVDVEVPRSVPSGLPVGGAIGAP